MLNCFVEHIEHEEEFQQNSILDNSNFVVAGKKGAVIFKFNSSFLRGPVKVNKNIIKTYNLVVYSLDSFGSSEEITEDKCHYLNDQPCYSVQSAEPAIRIIERLKKKNQFDEDHLFEELKWLYNGIFKESE